MQKAIDPEFGEIPGKFEGKAELWNPVLFFLFTFAISVNPKLP